MSNKNVHLGENIILWSSSAGDFAYQDSCSIDFNQELIELTATQGGQRRYTKGKRDARISLTGLLAINNFLIDNSIKNLFDLYNSLDDNIITIKFEYATTGEYIEAPCIIQSFNYSGDSTGYGTYSATLQVTGDVLWQ